MNQQKQKKIQTRKPNKQRNRIAIPRAMPNNALVIPERTTTTLRYVDPFLVRANAGSNYLFYRFRANALFDPDPIILSGSVSGFKEWTQFYSSFRVFTHSFRMNTSNTENFPVIWGAFYSSNDATSLISTRDLAIAALENPNSTRARLMSAKGGQDRDFQERSMELSKLLGDPSQYFSDTNYVGSPSSDPSTTLWLNLIIASPTAATLSNGCVTALTMESEVEFFNRIPLVA